VKKAVEVKKAVVITYGVVLDLLAMMGVAIKSMMQFRV